MSNLDSLVSRIQKDLASDHEVISVAVEDNRVDYSHLLGHVPREKVLTSMLIFYAHSDGDYYIFKNRFGSSGWTRAETFQEIYNESDNDKTIEIRRIRDYE